MFPLLLSQFREEGKRALSSDLKPLIKGRKQVGVLLDMYLCYGARNFGEGRIVIIRPLAAMGQEQRDKSEKVAVGAVRTPRTSRPPVGSFDSTSVVLFPIRKSLYGYDHSEMPISSFADSPTRESGNRRLFRDFRSSLQLQQSLQESLLTLSTPWASLPGRGPSGGLGSAKLGSNLHGKEILFPTVLKERALKKRDPFAVVAPVIACL